MKLPKAKKSPWRWGVPVIAGLLVLAVWGRIETGWQLDRESTTQADDMQAMIAGLSGRCPDPGGMAALMESGMIREVREIKDNAWKWNEQDRLGLAHAAQKGYRVCPDPGMSSYAAVYDPDRRLLSYDPALPDETAVLAIRRGLRELHSRDWRRNSGVEPVKPDTSFAVPTDISSIKEDVLPMAGALPSPSF